MVTEFCLAPVLLEHFAQSVGIVVLRRDVSEYGFISLNLTIPLECPPYLRGFIELSVISEKGVANPIIYEISERKRLQRACLRSAARLALEALEVV